MHIISNIALISINETLIIQLVSFLIFLFVINRVMFRPLIEERNKRNSYMGKIETDIADAINNFDDITRKINANETEAKKEAMNFSNELKVSGTEEAAKILRSARLKIIDIRKIAESEIDIWLLEAKKSIKEEAEHLSVNILEKVLDRRLAS